MSASGWRPSNAPPSYQQTFRPTILTLDGGGTRVVCQLFMLCELMHRLAWDLKLIPSTTSTVYPAECFDFIGAGGTGSIVAFLLACGYSAEEAKVNFIRLASRLRNISDRLEIRQMLERLLPAHQKVVYDGENFMDFPCATNIWIADSVNSEGTTGNIVYKGDPISECLIPLVVEEVFNELAGRTQTLDHTLSFLQSVFPVFDDCSILVSLGSGDVPPPTPSSAAPKRSWSGDSSWLPTSYTPFSWLFQSSSPISSPTLPALPSSRATLEQNLALNSYIPTRSYGTNYLRFQPNLIIWSLSGEKRWPGDWDCDNFGEHKSLTTSYYLKMENGLKFDKIVENLKRRKNYIHTSLHDPSLRTQQDEDLDLVIASAAIAAVY
ncbi:hypothetical protein CPB86DRAFT_601360 [Serendipita vermifera]|nr:hypothetical protein CPB86DRAFT_601360 [Serendipita vermifera]